ncbi:MAG: family 43 glycosylhydrolase [Bacteroidota bacterium]
MKQFSLFFLIAVLFSACQSAKQAKANLRKDLQLTTAEKRAFLSSHDQAFQAFHARIRDPFIMLGPDNYYYLTGTTAGSHWGDTIGIHLWRSNDLAKWEDMGFVWDLHKDGKSANSWHFQRTLNERQQGFKNPRAIWAPEIHFLNGTWWIPHCMNGGGHGLLKSTSGKPEGPYEVLAPVEKRRIDAHLYQEDGNTYYAWQADQLVQLKNDLSAPAGNSLKLQHEGNHPLGYEGILLLKLEDKYLHIASGRYGYETTNTYDLYYAVSDKLEGPYGPRRMAIKNAGHGNLFKDKNGRWWSTAFDHEFSKGWTLWLVPIDIKVTKNDILFAVKDARFRPNKEDQKTVQVLAKTGIPKEWEGKAPWYRPEKNKSIIIK